MSINQKTVLVAGDNHAENLRLSILLKRLDYYVVTAVNCSDVIKTMTNIQPNIALLNIKIPETGSAGCLALIQKNAKLKTIPVVIMGEKSDAHVMEQYLKRGAAAYIFKPVTPTPLYRLVQKLTEERPRENIRARIIFKTTISYQHGRRVSFASMLSEKGVFIRTVKPIPVGTNVSVSMDLPSEKPVELEGVVIYIMGPTTNHFMEPGMFIRFSNIDSYIELELRRFIEEQLTYDLDPNLDL